MDTKWIKYKYSSLNKFLCAFIAAVLGGIACVNIVTAATHAVCFGTNGLVNHADVSLIDSYRFKEDLEDNIGTIVDDVSHNENQAAYDAAKAATVETATEFAEYAIPYLQNYNEQIRDYRNWENTESYEYIEYPTLDIPDPQRYGVFDIGYNTDYDGYISDFSFRLEIRNDEFLSDSISFSFDNINEQNTESLQNQFGTQFGDQAYYSYCHNTGEAGGSAALGLLNVRYYAEYTDGSVATNVTDPESFINSVRSAEGEYFMLENGEYTSSSRMRGVDFFGGDYYGNTANNVRLYILVDPTFAAEDIYGQINARLGSIIAADANTALYVAAFTLLGCIAFAVISVRLAGNTNNGGRSAAAIDKLPCDIHMVLTGLAASGLVVLVLTLLASHFHAVFELNYRIYFDMSGDFFSSQWYKNILFALGAAIYLVILEFAVSTARSAKAGVNLFKHTFIYKIIALIVRFFKWLVRAIKKSNRKIKDFFNTVAFRPERLEKKAVRAVALFSAFNIFGIAFASLLFAAFGLDFGAFVFGWLCICAVIAVDAVCVYKAFKYMRSLDALIDKSAKNEPIDMDISALPVSLQTLARSLDEKNAQLQNAVIKAVKDERTKTELITNVSHDLKTPLTSVINYIDLLKKCDIQDETAQKYMGVIAEKANRLKRLIEDLIEASKVSTGNVVLNRTKINLNELAAQAIVEETADIEKNDLQIIFDESAVKHIVYADGTKIYRVFENLLSNARKYSAPGSRIYARLFSGREYGCFEIKNISKEPLNITAEELTERFVRGDKARTEEGNGLGLSIAKELCRLNGGKLDIQIDGDLFKATVMLPLSRAEEHNEKQN